MYNSGDDWRKKRAGAKIKIKIKIRYMGAEKRNDLTSWHASPPGWLRLHVLAAPRYWCSSPGLGYFGYMLQWVHAVRGWEGFEVEAARRCMPWFGET